MAKEVSMIVSWNGRLLAEDEVKVSPFDGGLLRGEGVFETMRALDGRVCFWARHFLRLLNSAKKLSISVPDPEVLERGILEVLNANDLTEGEARVRLTLSANILMTAVRLPALPKLCRVVTSVSPINELSPLAGAKVCSYAENMTVLRISGVEEAIRPNTKGELCEGCLSNVFFVIAGVVHTPSLETGCLPGVSRSVLLERNSEMQEGQWPVSILKRADEIWLTSSTRLMTWVDECDGRSMGAPGELFHRTLADLREGAGRSS
ncbi:aminotransferase class IV [Verrucomicrobiaceae bacterium 227]